MFNFHIYTELKKYFGGYNSDQGFGFQSLPTPTQEQGMLKINDGSEELGCTDCSWLSWSESALSIHHVLGTVPV